MKIIDSGHYYKFHQLDMPEGKQSDTVYPSEIRFVKRVGKKFPGNVISYPGTTMQEVLRALISRCHYLYNQTPCWQTKLAIPLMKACVWLFEMRAAHRHGRSAPGFNEAVYGEFCTICGHVGCKGGCHADASVSGDGGSPVPRVETIRTHS